MAENSISVTLPGSSLYPDDCRIQTLVYSDATALSLLPKTLDTQKLFEIIGKRINLDVKTLTLQDFWFILYWQRINSYSSFPIKLPWECPHCRTKNIDELTGSKLVIDDLDKDYYHGMEVDFPDSGRLFFRLKLVGDEILAKKYVRDNKVTDPSPELFDEILAACMLEHSGGTLEERLQIVQNMSAEDQFVLKALESEFDYGVKSYANFSCENCKEVVKVSYNFDLSSFFPSVQDKSTVRSRILLRKAPKSTDKFTTGDGFHEDDLHKGDAYQVPQRSERQAKSSELEQVEEKITLTPEQLKQLILEGIKESQREESFIDYSDLDRM